MRESELYMFQIQLPDKYQELYIKEFCTKFLHSTGKAVIKPHVEDLGIEGLKILVFWYRVFDDENQDEIYRRYLDALLHRV